MRAVWVVLALMATGCVGDGVEFGGVRKPAVGLAGQGMDCKQAAPEITKLVPVVYPGDVIMFQMASGSASISERVLLAYDVDETGTPVNIRHVGDRECLRWTPCQKLVKASANAVEQWRLGWSGPAKYLTGCSFDLSIRYSERTGPGFERD